MNWIQKGSKNVVTDNKRGGGGRLRDAIRLGIRYDPLESGKMSSKLMNTQGKALSVESVVILLLGDGLFDLYLREGCN